MMVMMMVVVMVMMVATCCTSTADAATATARQVRYANAHRIGAATSSHYLYHTIRATTIDGDHFGSLVTRC
uniref:Putative secreted protein n=1 Tax=Anopheles darlingi TaxID=43151 RepID=A0A2M4D9N1_ANODA